MTQHTNREFEERYQRELESRSWGVPAVIIAAALAGLFLFVLFSGANAPITPADRQVNVPTTPTIPVAPPVPMAPRN